MQAFHGGITEDFVDTIPINVLSSLGFPDLLRPDNVRVLLPGGFGRFLGAIEELCAMTMVEGNVGASFFFEDGFFACELLDSRST